MANSPDTLVVTGQVFQQTSADDLLVTPTGASQVRLADALMTATGGAVSATTLTASSTVTLSPANHNVTLSPTGTGEVIIGPATAGTVDNVVIGGGTPLAGTFTTLSAASLIATGNVSAAFAAQGIANGITAAGSNLATATLLTKAENFLGTVTTGQGVGLPAIGSAANQTPVGGVALLFNAGAGTVSVYGQSGNLIDNTAGTTGVLLSNAKRCLYFATTGSTYISAQLGAVSA